MSDAIVTYNNKTVPPSGYGPTPYVSLGKDVLVYGDRWGLVDKITLNGQITGSDFDAVYTAQTGLVDVFSSSYKTLSILESPDGTNSYGNVFNFNTCSVQGISFENNGYNKVVGYTVEMLSYPSGLTGYFSGTFGVIEPKDDISMAKSEDGTVSITRSIQAKAFVTTTIDDALSNAKNFVWGRTGIANVLAMAQISGFENPTSFTPVLVGQSENLDRLNLTYSIDQDYRFKLITGDIEAKNNYSFNNYYLTSYSTNLVSGAGDPFVTASIQGDIKAGITGASGDVLISGLLDQLSGLNPYIVISGKYGTPNNLTFCKDPIQFSVNQDLKARKISFSASYDNLEFYNSVDNKSTLNGCYLDASVSQNTDELTKITTIKVNGEIKCRGSNINRYINSLAYASGVCTAGTDPTYPRIYDFANDYYTSYFGGGYIFGLNQTPNELVIDADPNLGTVSLSATFDNKDRFQSLGGSDYSISYSPYNTVYGYASSCNDSIKHLAVDVNIKKREKASIDLTVVDKSKSELQLAQAKDIIINGFEDSFVTPIAVLNSKQEESSSMGIQNSSSTNSLTSDKYNATIQASKSYSFELIPSIFSNRRVIKSAGNTGNV
jgi:hypothetical protein